MKKVIFIFLIGFCSSILNISADTAASKNIEIPASGEDSLDIPTFTPPPGWYEVDKKLLPKTVSVMVVGKGKNAYAPSMNLATQSFKGTLKDYLKIVKASNDSKGHQWKDLGKIDTSAGPASFSQVDTKSEWGSIRQMHVILLKNQKIYILTASATTEEFPKFYKEFFKSMRSLKINKDLFEMIPNTNRKNQLKSGYQTVQKEWASLIAKQQLAMPESSLDEIKKNVWESEEFKNTAWNPFKEIVDKQFTDMGLDWQKLILEKTQNDLMYK